MALAAAAKVGAAKEAAQEAGSQVDMVEAAPEGKAIVAAEGAPTAPHFPRRCSH